MATNGGVGVKKAQTVPAYNEDAAPHESVDKDEEEFIMPNVRF